METTKNVTWSIQNKKTKQFLNKNPNYGFTRKLQNALLLPSRSIARKLCRTSNEFRVCRIEVDMENMDLKIS